MTTKSKRATKQLTTIVCPRGDALDLLHLVVERICSLDKNDWSRKATAERKRLEALRGMLEEALVR